MKKTKYFKRITAGVVIMTLLAGLAGCTGKDNEGTKLGKSQSLSAEKLTAEKVIQTEGKEADAQFVKGTSDFSVELLKASCLKDIKDGKNVLISPVSVISALGMTANGANGRTLEQMEKVLTSTGNVNDLNKYMFTFMNELTSNKDVTLKNANSIWLRSDEENGDALSVKDDFVGNCDAYYNASVYKAKFDDSTVKDINSWVDENTDNMIPKLLDEISESTVMYLINAMAFEGVWQDPFTGENVDEDAEFRNSKGEKEKATMLYGSEYSFIKSEDATGFIKPYEGEKYAFMAILPNENVDMSEYLDGLTGDKLVALYNSDNNEETRIAIPEFTYDYSLSLKNPLIALGMEDAFDLNADFSNMSDNELSISDVIHKTHIELDRNGTKAAAVTSVEVAETCMQSEVEIHKVYLDRPFVYAIIDTDTGIPVFEGVINTIEN